MVAEQREEIPLTKLLEAILPYQSSIYVTVLNIIQCIALAFLINESKDIIIRDELSLAWALRSAVALAIILVIWHRYISESQYLWPMSWLDTLIPFSIGITECVIIFSTNTKTISLYGFVWSITILQILVTFAYGYAYSKRKMKVTEKLYQSVYVNRPQFVSNLLNFLRNYDRGNTRRIGFFLEISCVFIILIKFLPNNVYAILFPITYLIIMLQGEVFHGFYKSLKKDMLVGPYFQ